MLRLLDSCHPVNILFNRMQRRMDRIRHKIEKKRVTYISRDKLYRLLRKLVCQMPVLSHLRPSPSNRCISLLSLYLGPRCSRRHKIIPSRQNPKKLVQLSLHRMEPYRHAPIPRRLQILRRNLLPFCQPKPDLRLPLPRPRIKFMPEPMLTPPRQKRRPRRATQRAGDLPIPNRVPPSANASMCGVGTSGDP